MKADNFPKSPARVLLQLVPNHLRFFPNFQSLPVGQYCSGDAVSSGIFWHLIDITSESREEISFCSGDRRVGAWTFKSDHNEPFLTGHKVYRCLFIL